MVALSRSRLTTKPLPLTGVPPRVPEILTTAETALLSSCAEAAKGNSRSRARAVRVSIRFEKGRIAVKR
jgi:hypothetical protein